MSHSTLPPVIERLQAAWNAHDIEAVAACFHPDYDSVQPLHPERSFSGVAAVRRSWQATFEGVPDLRAELCRCGLGGDAVWTEWAWHGTHLSGRAFNAGGVMVFGVQADRLRWARVYTCISECAGPNSDSILADMLDHPTP